MIKKVNSDNGVTCIFTDNYVINSVLIIVPDSKEITKEVEGVRKKVKEVVGTTRNGVHAMLEMIIKESDLEKFKDSTHMQELVKDKPEFERVVNKHITSYLHNEDKNKREKEAQLQEIHSLQCELTSKDLKTQISILKRALELHKLNETIEKDIVEPTSKFVDKLLTGVVQLFPDGDTEDNNMNEHNRREDNKASELGTDIDVEDIIAFFNFMGTKRDDKAKANANVRGNAKPFCATDIPKRRTQPTQVNLDIAKVLNVLSEDKNVNKKWKNITQDVKEVSTDTCYNYDPIFFTNTCKYNESCAACPVYKFKD